LGRDNSKCRTSERAGKRGIAGRGGGQTTHEKLAIYYRDAFAPVTRDELLLAHTPQYVDAFLAGTQARCERWEGTV
jgi:hypothetical protein